MGSSISESCPREEREKEHPRSGLFEMIKLRELPSSQIPGTHCRTPGGSRRSHTWPMTARGTAFGGCGPRRPAPRRWRARPSAPAASASTRLAVAAAAAAATLGTAIAQTRWRQPSWPADRSHVTALPRAVRSRTRAPEMGGEKAEEGVVP